MGYITVASAQGAGGSRGGARGAMAPPKVLKIFVIVTKIDDHNDKRTQMNGHRFIDRKPITNDAHV